MELLIGLGVIVWFISSFSSNDDISVEDLNLPEWRISIADDEGYLNQMLKVACDYSHYDVWGEAAEYRYSVLRMAGCTHTEAINGLESRMSND
jgi:hypothetical protein